MQRNGDFLIRDSLTSLGDYVLTCRWHNQALHFKINKVVVKAGESYTHTQYLFEQESFDHVPALVRYHVGSRKAVSERSGAVIYCPVNRTFPLRYLEASYGLSQAGSKAASPVSPSGSKGGHMKRRSVTMTDGLTADKVTRGDGCPNRSARSPLSPGLLDGALLMRKRVWKGGPASLSCVRLCAGRWELERMRAPAEGPGESLSVPGMETMRTSWVLACMSLPGIPLGTGEAQRSLSSLGSARCPQAMSLCP